MKLIPHVFAPDYKKTVKDAANKYFEENKIECKISVKGFDKYMETFYPKNIS